MDIPEGGAAGCFIFALMGYNLFLNVCNLRASIYFWSAHSLPFMFETTNLGELFVNDKDG